MKDQPGDWPAQRIRDAIREKGISQAALARSAGLAESSVRTALIDLYQPRAEAAVAELLGVPAHLIWPSRYFPDGRRRVAPRIKRNVSAAPETKQRQILEAL